MQHSIKSKSLELSLDKKMCECGNEIKHPNAMCCAICICENCGNEKALPKSKIGKNCLQQHICYICGQYALIVSGMCQTCATTLKNTNICKLCNAGLIRRGYPCCDKCYTTNKKQRCVVCQSRGAISVPEFDNKCNICYAYRNISNSSSHEIKLNPSQIFGNKSPTTLPPTSTQTAIPMATPMVQHVPIYIPYPHPYPNPYPNPYAHLYHHQFPMYPHPGTYQNTGYHDPAIISTNAQPMQSPSMSVHSYTEQTNDDKNDTDIQKPTPIPVMQFMQLFNQRTQKANSSHEHDASETSRSSKSSHASSD
jgi:hypothetical protein